jgi:peptidoglycan/xylan/chitin deacetylase (PgdA/CDA1 family)
MPSSCVKKSPTFRSRVKNLLIFLYQKILLRKPVSILMYHSVSRSDHFFTVSPENFVEQMKYLHDHKYAVISFKDVLFLVTHKKPVPKKTVVLTFDDGYADNYTEVFPIIKKYNFPITIFLTTGFVGTSRVLRTGERMQILSLTQIREMHESGLVTFEPHGHTHQKLVHLDVPTMTQEILDSKKYINETLGWPTSVYAYTAGRYDDKVLSVISPIFSYAVSVHAGFCDARDFAICPLALPRQSVDSSTNISQFKLKI